MIEIVNRLHWERDAELYFLVFLWHRGSANSPFALAASVNGRGSDAKVEDHDDETKGHSTIVCVEEQVCETCQNIAVDEVL